MNLQTCGSKRGGGVKRGRIGEGTGWVNRIEEKSLGRETRIRERGKEKGRDREG